MLAAGAHADVQRRLPSFGVRRALGFTPGALVLAQAAAAARVAVPAAAARARGRRARRRRADARPARPAQRGGARRRARARPARAAWPASRCSSAPRARGRRGGPRAGRRPTVLRGGDLAPPRRRRGAGRLRAGLLGTGARFALAARARWAASVATVAMCAGVVGADARARLAARAPARRPGHGRQALRARRAAAAGGRRRGARRSRAWRTPRRAT